MMLVVSTVWVFWRLMLAQTRSRLSVELASSAAVVRDAVREDVGDRDFEGDREDVEAGEDVFARRAARARDAAEIVAVQVDQVEDSLLVELIGIVELAGDDRGRRSTACG